MATKLGDFLIYISQNPEALSAFENDPMTAMEAAGLSSAEKAVLQTGDANVIRTALAEEVGDPLALRPITIPITKLFVI